MENFLSAELRNAGQRHAEPLSPTFSQGTQAEPRCKADQERPRPVPNARRGSYARAAAREGAVFRQPRAQERDT